VRRPVKSRLRRPGGLLNPGLSGLLLLVWIGAAFAAGYALLRRRDVH
jgi:hypothetical protein